jgi:hypothetical protein
MWCYHMTFAFNHSVFLQLRGRFGVIGLLATLLLGGCEKKVTKPTEVHELLQGTHAVEWVKAGMSDEGTSEVRDGLLSMRAGSPMTGIRYTGWSKLGISLDRYEIEYETRRTEGGDFFGSLTFPVRESGMTLILGGWGGCLVGVSSIDDEDASENSTRGNLNVINGQWYRVRVRLDGSDLRVWINERLFVNTSLRGRKTGLRAGEIEKCLPLGFASWLTDAEVRALRVRSLE